MSIRVVSTAVITAGIAFQASAGVTYTSQTRTIEVKAGEPVVGSGIIAATDFGGFDRSVEIFGDNPPPEFDSYGFASQLSSLAQDAIRFSGDCHGTDWYGSGGVGIGTGESILDVTFEYTGLPTTWDLTMTGPVGRITGTFLKFERLGTGAEVFVNRQSFTESPPWADSGMMTSGTYRIQARVLGGYAGFGTGSGGGPYDMTLIIPSPATLALLGLGGFGVVRRWRARH